MSSVTLFYSVFTVALVYFGFTKRVFDTFSLAFFSAGVYFSPAFHGYVMNPNNFHVSKILPECYFVYAFVLSGILLTALVSDWLLKNEILFFVKINENVLLFTSLLLCYSGILVCFYLYGDLYFSNDKGTLLKAIREGGGRWHIMWAYGELFLGVFAICYKRSVYIIFSFVAIGLDLYFSGHRSTTMFIFLSSLLYFLVNSKSTRLIPKFLKIKNLLKTIILLFIGAFFFVFKAMLPQLKGGHSSILFQRMFKNTEFFSDAFLMAEQSIIQANLNQTIKNNIQTDMLNPIDFINHIFIFPNYLGLKSNANYLNQDELFPGVSWGTAHNIWATMISSGGYELFIMYVFVFCIILFFLDYFIKRSSGPLQIFLITNAVIFAFYQHRNDIFFQIDMHKRVVITFILLLISSLLWKSFTKKRT